MRIKCPVSANAKNGFTRCVVLKSCLKKTLERLCRFSAYHFHNTLLGFLESVRMRSLDGCLTESLSVVVITIWLWVMT